MCLMRRAEKRRFVPTRLRDRESEGRRAMDEQEKMIEEVLRHLDHEMEIGALKMSVNFNELQEEEKLIDHKCCHMYGRPVNEVVGFLDMYSDSSMEKN